MTRKEIVRILEFRQAGLSLSQIGERMGVHRTTIKRALQKFDENRGGKVSSTNERAPDPKLYNQVVDSTDIDGQISLVRMDRPAGPEELAKLAGLDLNKWIPKYPKIKTWQGMGKVKVGDKEKLEKIQLYASSCAFEPLMAEPVERAIVDFIDRNVKAKPAPLKTRLDAARKRVIDNPQMLVAGWWDTHLGMYAWNVEVGASFDLDIALRRMKNSFDDLLLEVEKFPISKVVLPVGNDLLHYDSVKKTTTFGDHHLDCDTRYSKVYLGATESFVHIIDGFLELGIPEIHVPYVPGNHDYTSGFCIASFLSAWYRNDPRVTFDLGFNPRKYIVHGGTVIGFDHGKDVKDAQYPIVLACEAKELWAKSTWREMQIGHTHQRKEHYFKGVTPTNGVLVRTNPSLSGTDAWHHGKGFLGEPLKSMEAWRYDHTGYRGSHVALARDN